MGCYQRSGWFLNHLLSDLQLPLFKSTDNYIEKYVTKRSIAVTMVYLAAFAILTLLISLAVPMIYESISEMFPAFYSGLGEIGVFVKENFNYDISSLMRHIQNIVNAFFKDSVVLDTTIDVLNQVMINVTNF